jgi:hypothetical protein
MIANGQLVPKVIRDGCPTNLSAVGEPAGTRSQFIRYSNNAGQWVVEVHQYLRPDGTIGASGRPDPKRLRIRNTVYIFDPGL